MTNGNDPKKEDIVKRRHFAFRLNVFFFCVFVLFSILIVRLAILQFVEGEELRAMKNSSSVASYDVPPIRGNIYDRNAYPIAISTSTQSLYYQYDYGQADDEVIALAKRLEKVFRDNRGKPMSAAEIITAMDTGFDINKKKTIFKDYYSSPRRIKTDLTKEEIAYIMEHRDEFKNFDIVEESIREYNTKDTIAVQLVGYLRQYSTAINHIDYYKKSTDDYLLTENVGFDGIELMYEKELRGKNGSKTYPINALGQIIGEPLIVPPTKGNNLYLTIDKDVQLAAENKIIQHLDFLKKDPTSRKVNPEGVNARAAYAVAMEVETGRVVAMVSYPDYNPDVWRNGRISGGDWQKYQYRFPNGTIKGTWADIPDDKERSKHPGSLVALGSTMKPLTILVGLKEGLINANSTYNDRGIYEYGKDKSKISNSKKHAYGALNPERAIVKSSNTYMAAMVGNPLYMRYGKKSVEVWDSYMEQFGLGVTTGSGLPGEQAGHKEYESTAKQSSSQAAMVFASFGQGGNYTALQLAQYAATLANEGNRPKPQFVDKITSYDGNIIHELKPEFLNKVEFPKTYWDLVKKAMTQVAEQGFSDFPYTLASKTGTSQTQVSGGRLVENAVFISYAPAEKPKLAVAVIVPEGGYGAWGAAPIARAIYDAYDKSVGLSDKQKTEKPLDKASN